MLELLETIVVNLLDFCKENIGIWKNVPYVEIKSPKVNKYFRSITSHFEIAQEILKKW